MVKLQRIPHIKHTILAYIFLCFGVVRCGPQISCDSTNPEVKDLPFCNRNLPVSERAKDLVSRLSIEEKLAQLGNGAPAIPRLNISAFEWWSEALHGISKHGRGMKFNGTITAATQFPQVILLASSFDTLLWYRISKAIGQEARAMYNAGQAMGLALWGPNINIFRDPRWGRGQETPGEDPLVVGDYGLMYVRGLQGDSYEGGQLKDGEIQASGCCKHFIAGDLDNWKEFNRYTFNAKVNKQDLEDSYQPPFKTCIQKAQATGVMCAYNQFNGVPSCADKNLLTNIAREQWGFNGYIVSDCDAVGIIFKDQKYVTAIEDTVPLTLKAGMDLNCGGTIQRFGKAALDQKKLEIPEIDRALVNLFQVRMRLGLIDGDPKKLPYGNIGADVACSKEHLDLSLEAARNGIVLLKNSADLLPLSKGKVRNLAVIGPSASNTEVFAGNYEGYACKNITVLQAMQYYVGSPLSYHKGCSHINCTDAAIDEAVNIAKKADHVVLVMGLDQTAEREKHDRLELVLPANQENLIQSIAKASLRPVVLVLLTGGPVDISFAIKNPKIGSILWAGYPGESGGVAIAETIFGDNNPGGKLPNTWYPKDYISVPMSDMGMRPDASTGNLGRTYRFYTGTPVFEFGFGLSYTKYTYKFVSVTPSRLHFDLSVLPDSVQSGDSARFALTSTIGNQVCKSSTFKTIVKVTNQGHMAGVHPVLLFIRDDVVRKGNPIKQLIAFQSVNLRPGQSTDVVFSVNPCDNLGKANVDGSWVIEEGKYHLMVAGEQLNFTVVL